MALRISAQKGLLSGKFRHGGIAVDEERWTDVDADDAKIRATLLIYVPTHIRLMQSQEIALAKHGLELKDNRLIDLRAAKAAVEAAAATEKKKEQPKAAPARA